MKKLLLLSLVILVISGCVSNQAFRTERERMDKMEAELAQNNTELGVLRREIMQSRRGGSTEAAVDSLFNLVRDMSREQTQTTAQLHDDIAFLIDRVNSLQQLSAENKDAILEINADMTYMRDDTQEVLDGFAAYIADLQGGNLDLATKEELTQLSQTVESTDQAMNRKLGELEKAVANLKAAATGTEPVIYETTMSGDLEARIAKISAQIEEYRALNRKEYDTLKTRVDKLSSDLDSLDGGVKPATKPVSQSEKAAYETARMEYEKGNYQRSIDMMNSFASQHPDSDYAGNAIYWKGESYYAMGDYSSALREFQNVISRYPDSWKAADSQLKIGMCHMQL
ncbi:MAG TPA: tetratricopeptide repeat protein, partial [Candidatus Cloacimonadota bacterium]|nr:tetratricopeptide repeat protein [Candidatus Cloacimonadota bacterium]